MKHYIDQETGELYAYEADGSQDAFIKKGLEPVTDAEAEAMRAAKVQPVPRADVIRARLAVIDADSIRALRAVARGKAIKADTDKLDALDTEAAALRAELAALGPA